jgi:phosphonate transport system ATP-binding protein
MTLTVKSLHKVWPNKTVALRDVSLSVERDEFVAILGGSGAGKSTLLRCIAQLTAVTEGTVTLNGQTLTQLRGKSLTKARSHIGFVFQQFNLVPRYTALENVLLARVAKRPWLAGLLGRWTAQDVSFATECLARVGLDDKLHAPARELSGGQQQRVAIARVFAQQPALILADEPTASLDPKLAETVLTLLKEYGQSQSIAVLVNVHTVEHARTFATRVLGLHRGVVTHDGPITTLTEATLSHIYRD